jgi:hypothetical protein
MEDEPGDVYLILNEALCEQECAGATVPSSRHLLEAVERPVELADHVGVSRVYKTDRLGAIHHPRQSVMDERILDVELMHRQDRERARVRIVQLVACFIKRLKVLVHPGMLGEAL